MIKIWGILVLCLTLTLPVLVQAEELVLFDSSSAGEDVWSWGDAKVLKDGQHLTVTETNPKGDYGDAYVSDRFSYLPDAEVLLDIGLVKSGGFTLQALAFKGEGHFTTVDIVKDSSVAGARKYKLGGLGLPVETETVLFKFWVAGAEGAATQINQLKYYLPLEPGQLMHLDTCTEGPKWQTDKLSAAVMPGGLELSLLPDQTFGSALYSSQFPMSDIKSGTALFDVHNVSNGVVSIQVIAFNAEGVFLKDVPVVQNVAAGLHAIRFGDLYGWPSETASVGFKVWLAGNAGATARLQRVMVLKPGTAAPPKPPAPEAPAETKPVPAQK